MRIAKEKLHHLQELVKVVQEGGTTIPMDDLADLSLLSLGEGSQSTSQFGESEEEAEEVADEDEENDKEDEDEEEDGVELADEGASQVSKGSQQRYQVILTRYVILLHFRSCQYDPFTCIMGAGVCTSMWN